MLKSTKDKRMSKESMKVTEDIEEMMKELKSCSNRLGLGLYLSLFYIIPIIFIVFSDRIFTTNILDDIIALIFKLYNINPIASIGILVTIGGVFITYFAFLTFSELSKERGSKYEKWIGAVIFFNNVVFLPIFVIIILSTIKTFPQIINNFLLTKVLLISLFFILLLSYQDSLHKKLLKEVNKYTDYGSLYKLTRRSILFSLFNWFKIFVYSLPLFLISFSLLKMNISWYGFIFVLWIFFIGLTFLGSITALNLKRCYLVDIKTKNKIFKDAILIRLEENFIRFVPKPTKKKNLSSKLININDIVEIEYKK